MILGTDKTKLSKRHGAASTLEYREMGYLPISMINFLVRLGWSHGDQEFFSLDELFQFFNLDKIGKAPAVFNTEKLNWISGHFFQTLPAGELAEYLKKHFASKLPYKEIENASLLEKGVHCIQGKVKTMLELIEQLDVLWGTDPEYDFSKIKKEDLENHKKYIALVKTALSSLEFKKEAIENVIKEVAAGLQIKVPPISQAIRFAVTGGRVSPGLFDMLEVMGKERVLRRLNSYEHKAGSV
jgi:glutamyl-tRNA synthetase